jgi:flagellar motility protein MotE (MotC chaperone)
MTFIGYKHEMKRIEALKQQAVQDSLQALDSLALAKKDSLKKSAQDSAPVEIMQEESTESPVGFTETGQTETATLNFKEVAKIYEKMKPTEAARILNQFSPEEASGILLNMKKRQAAKIITSMEPNLAAQISKRMLQKKPK